MAAKTRHPTSLKAELITLIDAYAEARVQECLAHEQASSTAVEDAARETANEAQLELHMFIANINIRKRKE